ncbi:MAG: hypothetical protein IJA86_09505 [Clostridia bacterium]|nr:hypothetical protein [Clostridia bacterium]
MTNSSIILTQNYRENNAVSAIRLIHSVDIFQNTDVFSVFLTTESDGKQTEEFIYDISRNKRDAKKFFSLLCEQKATADSLCELAANLIAG